MTGKTLYQISEDLLALDDLLFEVGGDISEEEAATAIEQWFAENEAALQQKLDGYGYLIRRQEADASFVDEEVKRLQARKQARENAAKRLKDRLKQFMEEHGMKDIETPHFRFAVQKNGGRTPIEVDVPPDQLPKEYQRVKIEPDIDKLRSKLESLPDDVGLPFAHFLPRGSHLRVR